jgi:hypothetical protein
MTLTQAKNILLHYQLWQLGEEITELPPERLTQAIDTILKSFKELYTKEEYLCAAELGEVSYHDAKHVVSLLDEARKFNNKK